MDYKHGLTFLYGGYKGNSGVYCEAFDVSFGRNPNRLSGL